MADVSSLLYLEVDSLGNPVSIYAFSAGDTLASSIIPSSINRATSGVNASSTLWNIVYTQVQASAGFWNVAAGVADLSYISGVMNSVSATAANSSSILNFSSGIWNGTYETVLANSATWGGISDASSLRGSPLSATLVPSAGQSLVYDGSVWTASTVVATGGGGGGGVTDHGALTGLADNDHPQYVLSATNNALSSLVNNHIASAVHWDIATLNNNYINASGDSANAAFYFQTLSATTISATSYLNIKPNVSSVNSAATTSFTAGNDYDTYLINTTTTSVIAYLPEASSYTNKMITFSKVDDGGSYRSVTVSGAQLVTATNTVILYDPTESVTVISNGTNWYSLDYDRSYGVVFVCKNSTGSTLTKGTPVKVTGATGANVLIGPVSAANNHIPSASNGQLSRCIGVVEHDIPNGEFGHVLTKGTLYKYNTNSFNEGDVLYLAASGGFTNVKPTPPYEEVFLGIVTRKQTNNGSILIDVANPIHINDIVGFNLASSLSERDVIAYDLTTSTFKNYNPSSFNVSSATSATLALSATSALNAQRAPNGFTVTGTLTATTASATTYLNLPSSIATWNASALQGKTLNAAAPTINDILRYNGTQWINDSETQYSLNSELGSSWVISGASGITFTTTTPNNFRVAASYTSGIWNASALQGSPLSATLVPTTNQGLIYNGSVWTASSINDVTNAVNAVSATNAFSATNALSATSALNASRAPAGFTVTGTLLATNISATNFSGIDHDTDILNVGTYTHAAIDAHITDTANPHSVTAEQVGNSTAQWNASAIQDIQVKNTSPTNRQVLVYASASNWWIPDNILATDVGNTTAQWNASSLRESALSGTLVPTTNQALVYNGSVWTASSITVGGGSGISAAEARTQSLIIQGFGGF